MITESGDSAPPNSKNKTPRAHYKASWTRVKEAATGRWSEILDALVSTFDTRCVSSNKGFPCPNCGGHDRFHYTDEGRGCWYCRHCANTKYGFPDGFNLIASCYSITDSEAKDLVGDYLGLNEPQSDTKKISYKAESQKIAPSSSASSEIKTTALAILANCGKGLPKYLEKKHFTTNDFDVNRSRFNLPNSKQFVPEGAWVIPIQNINDFKETISVQYIPEEGKIKYHLPGFKKDLGVIYINGNDSLPYIAIGTGAATCYSFAMAMGCITISAFDDAGMLKNSAKISSLFPGKKVLLIGDNDTHKGHTKGQYAAHTVADRIDGLAVIPLESGDWDDYRKKYGIEATTAEIAQQIVSFFPIEISETVIGLDLNYIITLKNGNKISLREALVHNLNSNIICPLSRGSAKINAEGVFSFTQKKIIVPILTALHTQTLIDECFALKTTKERVLWVNSHNTKKHLYALVFVLRGRFGVDISSVESFERLLNKYGKQFKIAPEIHAYIEYLFVSKIKKAAALCELDPKQFKNHREVKQNNEGVLNWQEVVDEIITSNQIVFGVQALHGQGKTEDLAYKLSRLITPVVYITHRSKLVSQGCTTLQFYHYADDKLAIQLAGHVDMLACCTPSFSKEINLNHIRRAKLIIIDEFIQWFSDLLTNKKCINDGLPLELQIAMKEAIANGCKILLMDADLTTVGIKQFMRFLNIQNKAVFLITAANPKRDLIAEISISAAAAHYQTYAIKRMKDDVAVGIPFLVAMESASAARNLFDLLVDNFSLVKNIVLITGDRCYVSNNGAKTQIKSKDYIDNINANLLNIDVCIYTPVLGTGVSIKHINQRFKKCYILAIGSVLSPMDVLQMAKRGRDVKEYIICIFSRPYESMTNFYSDLGTKAWRKISTEINDIDSIAAEIEFNKLQYKASFTAGLINLIKNKHQMKIIGQLSIEAKLDDLRSVTKLKEIDQQALINASPHPNFKHALARQMDEYTNDEERFSCEAAICINYFNIPFVTTDAAKIWCNSLLFEACERLEMIIKLHRSDPNLKVKDPEKQLKILIASGFILALFTNQRLDQGNIIKLRNSIAEYASVLVGLGFIPERYVKPSKISTKRPIKSIRIILEYIGLKVETIRIDTDRWLDISVPSPMISRLQLNIQSHQTIKLTKQEMRELERVEAHQYQANGFSLKKIGDIMNKTKRYIQELIKK